jgi:hypothetical protein
VKLVTPSPPAALRFGCAALLAVALCRCGLAADGQGSLVSGDAGQVTGGSSGGGSGGSTGGSSGDPSSSGATSSSGGTQDPLDGDTPDDATASDLDGPSASPRDAATDVRHPDAGPRDAAADGPSTCSKLNTCCGLLALYGSSAMSITSCMEAAATNDEGTCDTVLGPFEGLGLCP